MIFLTYQARGCTNHHTTRHSPPPSFIMLLSFQAPISIALYPPQFHRNILRLQSIDLLPLHPTQSNASHRTDSPKPRRRPFYFNDNMPTGRSNILPPIKANELMRSNPQSPRIRVHHATIHATRFILAKLSPRDGVLSPRKVPIIAQVAVKHFNTNYLNRTGDIKLHCQNLWKQIFRQHLSDVKFLPPNTSHEVIFIQRRYKKKHENNNYREMTRTRPTCPHQIGLMDFDTIESNLTIIQPVENGRLFYIAQDLHNRCHGSISLADVRTADAFMGLLGIATKSISPSDASSDGIVRSDDVTVAFNNSHNILDLDTSLVRGVVTLEHDLALALLESKEKDSSRWEGKVVEGVTSDNCRITTGFGRIQNERGDPNKWKVIHWRHDGKIMPTIKVGGFLSLKKSLKDMLQVLFEKAQLFVHEHHPNSFADRARNETCAKRLNKEMGYPLSKAKFEYYDMVISRNTTLPKHIDEKNDNRVGYNPCVVYSYYVTLNGLDYKVSVIMTTRCSIGAVMENL